MIAALPALAAAGSFVRAAATARTVPGVLPSWNEGPARRAILDFIRATTTGGSPDFVPLADRIITFDQDGTLWAELIFVTHAGMTQAAFLEIARTWLAAANHPRFRQLYTEEARSRHWTVISMRNDWKRMIAFDAP